MRGVAILGGADLEAVARSLDLVPQGDGASLALIDADDEDAVAAAAALAPDLPRVFVASATRASLLRAAAATHVVERPLTAARLGPAIFSIERSREPPPRVVLFLAATGATGRTSLVANLALRIAPRTPVIALDATGTGSLAWRLGTTVAPWSDLAAVGDELGEAHLRLAAAERDGALLLGGLGVPSEALLLRVLEIARGMGAALVDAPPHWFAPELRAIADRVYLCANPDPASAAATSSAFATALASGGQLVVSQARERDVQRLAALFGARPSFVLPPDEPACRDALARRGRTAGALGRAYDSLAEILLADLAA